MTAGGWELELNNDFMHPRILMETEPSQGILFGLYEKVRNGSERAQIREFVSHQHRM